MSIQNYLTKLNTLYITGKAREHSYRGDLQNLLHELLPDVLVTNEPARVACGAPDYVLTRKDIPVGYIEAKDIGVDLNSKTLKEQFDRYKAGLSNLIFTDYLDFHFYKDGELTTKIAIAKVENGSIVPLPQNFEHFEHLIKNFATTITQSIKSPTRLAQMMAGKAKLMADVIEKSLQSDDVNQTRSNLKTQMLSFQDMLIHDIDNKAFADIYAQTIAYGMFAARYHDPTLPTFSREEAATLIPKSNPFLRKLFQDIAGYDLDERLVWIVEELVRIFLATDVASIMKNFGRSTKQEDPVVHFYETFLASYSPALRKARGVWYTPQPVVNFIVRAVDDILKTEFGLKDGLADTSKTTIKVKAPKLDERSKQKAKVIGDKYIEQEVHKVQILDPATGTGTFLAEVVRHIHKKFEGQQGIWSSYVNNHLIPRLNGFELLMASYAMAHLKMDMLLTETGYKPTDDQRFRIFLTNSLEEHHKDTGNLFSEWLANEANEANAIKRDTPVMVVIGNPPYSGESSNTNEFINRLINDYKREENGDKLREHNTKWLNNDYLKFLRLSQYYIEKNKTGIIGFITSHSYLDSPTFRGVRYSLLKTFNKIYIINLNGHLEKKLKTSLNEKDENVFDIKEGVSIILGIKTTDDFASDIHYDELIGSRKLKYNYLENKSISNINWKIVKPQSNKFLFIENDYDKEEIYKKGISIGEIFQNYSTGVLTKNDSVAIAHKKEELQTIIKDFSIYSEFELINKYHLKKDSRDWKLKNAIEDVKYNINKDKIKPLLYRPFDIRYTFYTNKSKGFCAYSQYNLMRHIIDKNNIGLITTRINRQASLGYVFMTNMMSELHILDNARDSTSVFPLYVYNHESNNLFDKEEQTRIPNLNPKIVKEIAKGLGLTFVPEKEMLQQVQHDTASLQGDTTNEDIIASKAKQSKTSTDTNVIASEAKQSKTFAPIDLLDYIYAVLHSPAYREKYKEFLKIDFPRVPYPAPANLPEGEEKARERFWQLVALGGALREIHLLESPVIEQHIKEYQYPTEGDNIVGKPHYQDGKVYINYDKATPEAELQCFTGVPETAWNFYIGGYQPAQKWLKDRKGRELSYEDIAHYRKIIVALTQTHRLMQEIDTVLVLE